jgi:hypothetical protein
VGERAAATPALQRGKQIRGGLQREEARLLGIRAKAGADREREAGLAASRGGHAVEGRSDVGADGLSLPVCKRAGVAAAAGLRGHRGSTGVGSDLSRRPGAHLDPVASRAPRQMKPGLAAQHDRDARGREAHGRQRDLDPAPRDPVAARAAQRRRPGQREVGSIAEMARVRHATLEEGRLEQPRVLTAHDLSTRDSGEISRPLMLAASAERLSEAEQNQHPAEQGRQYAEQEQRGLAGLAV